MTTTATNAIALTGETGFVGKHVCLRAAELLQTTVPVGRAQGLDLMTATSTDWARALVGCDTCIHLAGALPWTKMPQENDKVIRMRNINIDGSLALFDGFAEAGGQHFIFLSTIGVNGYFTTNQSGPMRPNDPSAPDSPYAYSKAEAEVRLREQAALRGLSLTIVRPPLVYGPTSVGSFASLIRIVKKLPVLPLGGLDNHRDLIGVRNLADCLLTMAEEKPDGTFLICDRHSLTTTELVKLIASAYGRTLKLVTLPKKVRRILMSVSLTKPTAIRLLGDMNIDDSATAAACSWRPRFTPADEIARLGSSS